MSKLTVGSVSRVSESKSTNLILVHRQKAKSAPTSKENMTKNILKMSLRMIVTKNIQILIHKMNKWMTNSRRKLPWKKNSIKGLRMKDEETR
jgi:hypothetical protein